MSKSIDRVVSTSPQNPADVVIDISATEPSAVAAVVERAQVAQVEWSASSPNARGQALEEFAATVTRHEEELASLIVREVGKVATEAKGEVARTAAILRYYAQLALLPTGEHFRESAGGRSYTDRLPHGVAGLITPWNFPLAIPIWKAAPALVAGNAAVIKVAPEATACGLLLAELAAQCLPAGLFTSLPGGAATGAALVELADVISFTGSSAVGRSVAVRAAERGVPVQAELGGSNVSIVLPSADLETTAASIAGAATGYAGQKCTATSRIVIVGKNSSQVVDALVAAWASLVVGDPAATGTSVGPVISSAARDKVEEAAASSGGTVLQPAKLGGGGWMAAPTLVVEPSADAQILREEVFGPIAAVSVVPDTASAIRQVNQHPMRLVTAIYGQALDDVLLAADQVASGIVKVNRPTTGVDYWLPFGGLGASSYGQREQGTAALDFFAKQRTVSISVKP
jgi:aldehyde dehydrogenase (NAD+)